MVAGERRDWPHRAFRSRVPIRRQRGARPVAAGRPDAAHRVLDGRLGRSSATGTCEVIYDAEPRLADRCALTRLRAPRIAFCCWACWRWRSRSAPAALAAGAARPLVVGAVGAVALLVDLPVTTTPARSARLRGRDGKRRHRPLDRAARRRAAPLAGGRAGVAACRRPEPEPRRRRQRRGAAARAEDVASPSFDFDLRHLRTSFEELATAGRPAGCPICGSAQVTRRCRVAPAGLGAHWQGSRGEQRLGAAERGRAPGRLR